MIRAILSNRQRPDLPSVSIEFPIASYSETYQKLEAIGVGHIASRDCFVKKLDGDYPVLKRLQETEVNVDELDYLAKRIYQLPWRCFYRRAAVRRSADGRHENGIAITEFLWYVVYLKNQKRR